MRRSERVCRISAPCKINLHLRIGVRRDDGFHDLESVFLCLAFGDALWLRTLPGAPAEPDCLIQMEGAALESGGNIISRAVSLFRERTGFKHPLRIRAEKRIPLGGGLGGGSSDAASALMALNALSGASLPLEALEDMAAALGSDVPFFLRGGACWVRGRGEKLEPLPAPEGLRVVLVNPGFPSGTQAAFALLDREREKGPPVDCGVPSPEALKAALGEAPASWPYHNDFLPVFLAASEAASQRAYHGILRDFKDLGADFSGLSGAGSTCFGVFTQAGAAEQAAGVLKKKWNFVQLTFPLASRAHAVLQ